MTVLGIALVAPFIISAQNVNILVLLYTFAVMAASWDLLYGFTGQVNFGPVVPYGVAGFLVGWMSRDTSIHPLIILPVAALLATGMSVVLIGLPSLRLRVGYLAVVSLASTIVIQQIAVRFTGEEGISMIRPIFYDLKINYFASLTLLLVTVVVLLGLVNSRIGLHLKAVREDELLAEALGVDVVRTKILAYTVSSLFTAFAGGFVAMFIQHVDHLYFSIGTNFQVISMAIVGGLGTIIGPVIGTSILYYILSVFISQGVISQALNGVLMVLVIMLAPEGLYKLLRTLSSKISKAITKATSTPNRPQQDK